MDIPTVVCSSNYTAEVKAIKTAAMKIIEHKNHAARQILFFTDSQFIILALKNTKD